MLKPHRCTTCKQRFTLRRKLSEYLRKPKCPHCGSPSIWFDRWEYNARIARRKDACSCDGAHYIHRPGSMVWCKHHSTGPTDEDFYERHTA